VVTGLIALSEGPLRIDVLFSPADLEPDSYAGRTFVVIDILRATSAIVTALANGALDFRTVVTVDEALTLARKEDVILCGERRGLPIEGFHLGNSPREFNREVVGGKRLVMTTTNGTRAIEAAKIGSKVLIGSFLNRRYVVDFLASDGGDVVILCSGLRGRFSLEDTVGAGAISSCLSGDKADSAIAAERLFENYSSNLLQMLKESYAGRYLTSIGLEDDLPTCANIDSLRILPYFDFAKGVIWAAAGEG